jgi:hypothetical protein
MYRRITNFLIKTDYAAFPAVFAEQRTSICPPRWSRADRTLSSAGSRLNDGTPRKDYLTVTFTACEVESLSLPSPSYLAVNE